MISFLQPLPIGNAARILLSPPVGWRKVRVLRKATDDIADQNDPNAGLVYEGAETAIVDTTTLSNGSTYFYRPFYWNGTTWAAGASHSVLVTATAELTGPDPLDIVRERLAAGLKVEVAAGRLQNPTGTIQVFTAPPTFDNAKWPVFSIHLRDDPITEHFLGDTVAPDLFDGDANEWVESEGGLRRVRLEIIGWSINPDERLALHRATLKIMLGNLAVFEAAGLAQVEFSQTTAEDMESYAAPVFWTSCTFTCFAAAVVTSASPPVSDVVVDAEAA